jgi:glucose-1-phosphate thymidylyltransferase
MNLLIVAAGYSTRMSPLADEIPKHLLEVAQKPVISHIVEKFENTKKIENIYVITNNKYLDNFETWKNNLQTNSIKILTDNTSTVNNKLGAIGDINFAIKKLNLKGPLIIIGGDNLFDFELDEVLAQFEETKKDTIVLLEEKDKEQLKQLSVVEIDENNKVTFFEEKPKNPTQTLTSSFIYAFTKETVEDISKYLKEGNNPDQPGRFLQWLYPRKEVRGYIAKGNWIDVGTPENLEKANKVFKQ